MTAASSEVEICRVESKRNIADGLTKHVAAEDIRVHIGHTSQRYTQDRHAIVPHVSYISYNSTNTHAVIPTLRLTATYVIVKETYITEYHELLGAYL